VSDGRLFAVRPSTLLVLAAVGAAAVGAYLLLRGEPAGTDVTEPPAGGSRPEDPPGGERRLPLPTTGTLVIRVRTPDAVPLPANTRAGYVDAGQRRLRAVASDGTFRFSDAPLGKLEIVAEAEGYRPGSGVAVVQPLVPAEIVVTLEPRP
jgi:hypothetical protein